ncbi:MAG: hypothetical protein K9M56_05235 [Victivallales bacterium]|nr:hypothetical protein [Victivallales bacterium]
MNDVYIAEVSTVLPCSYDTDYIADRLYPSQKFDKKINELARKLATRYGIKRRTSVIDYESFPDIVLSDPEDHPRVWGRKIVDKLTQKIDRNEIGFFGLTYNVSPHIDYLPNLASQIVMDARLQNVDENDEVPFYGCASSIYSLEKALNYCREHERPAIVFTFDQCTTINLQPERNDPDFKKLLISNLLFADAGVGMLLIPEKMKHLYEKPLLKITDIRKQYVAGDLIKMKDGKFIMESTLKDVVPELVSNKLMKPFLIDNNLSTDDIKQWSIHQGGPKVLKQFCSKECLNLSKSQIKPSLEMFYKYGNTSSASCLLVLENFFNSSQTDKTSGTRGIVVGFGAGYYFGTLLYDWA